MKFWTESDLPASEKAAAIIVTLIVVVCAGYIAWHRWFL